MKSGDYCRRHVPAEASDTSDGGARDERWDREKFLSTFEYTGMVSEACRMIGIARSTAYLERQRNEEFAVAWADVEERATERLESEAFRRAHDGVSKMVVSAGQVLGQEQVYSDGLLQFLLKAKRPERYRDRVDVAHSGQVKKDVHVRVDLGKLNEEQLAQLVEISETLEA